MAKFKAVLFDLDGTLIDSEYFHFECWNEILDEHHVQLNYDDWLKNYAGIPMPVNAKNLADKYGLVSSLEEIIKKRENLTLERLKSKDVNLMPYARETLEFFCNRKLMIALVTSSPRQDVEAIFERNGLKKYFNLIITRSEVAKSKPNPESYNVCRVQLGLEKDDCLVFEDTINGIRSAKAASLTCYAVQSNVNEHHKLGMADKLFSDLQMAKNHLIENDLV